MKTRILSGMVLCGALAASVAEAATSTPVEEIYSGMSAAAIQKDQRANPAAERHSTGKTTCAWHEAEGVVADPLYAAYPSDEYTEKAYLSPANQSFVC